MCPPSSNRKWFPSSLHGGAVLLGVGVEGQFADPTPPWETGTNRYYCLGASATTQGSFRRKQGHEESNEEPLSDLVRGWQGTPGECAGGLSQGDWGGYRQTGLGDMVPHFLFSEDMGRPRWGQRKKGARLSDHNSSLPSPVTSCAFYHPFLPQ